MTEAGWCQPAIILCAWLCSACSGVEAFWGMNVNTEASPLLQTLLPLSDLVPQSPVSFSALTP